VFISKTKFIYKKHCKILKKNQQIKLSIYPSTIY